MVFIISTSSLCVLGPFCYSLSKRVNPWFFHHTENTEKLVWVFCFNVRTCVWTSNVRLCVCTFNVRIYVQYENLCLHVQCEKLCSTWESVLARSMWEILFNMRICVGTFNVRNYVEYENLCWHVQCEKLCLWIFFRWVCFVQKRELPMSQCCFVRGERFFSFMQTLWIVMRDARVIALIKRFDVTILEEQGAPASGLADFRPLSSRRWVGGLVG